MRLPWRSRVCVSMCWGGAAFQKLGFSAFSPGFPPLLSFPTCIKDTLLLVLSRWLDKCKIYKVNFTEEVLVEHNNNNNNNNNYG